MTTRTAAEAPDEAQALLDAVRRHQEAKAVYDTARAEHEAARVALVALLHDHGVVGFSL
jgi:hypothetical protein